MKIYPFSQTVNSSSREEELINQIRYEGMWMAEDVTNIRDVFQGAKLPPFFDYLIYPVQSDMFLICKDIEEIKERVWNISTDIFNQNEYYPDPTQILSAQHFSWKTMELKSLYEPLENCVDANINIDVIDV